MTTTRITGRRPLPLAAACIAAAFVLSSCGSTDTTVSGTQETEVALGDANDAAASTGTSLWDSSEVHSIEVTFDQAVYDEMIATYTDSGDKDWIAADITIDGVTFTDVGMRLKGNSSLRTVSTETAQSPEELPWLIALDKYIDDQNYQGTADIVIRSNSTETSMNEAVALELLGAAGLATEEAIAAAFAVNGSDAALRLAIEHPESEWVENNFTADDSLLYKADSEGDYSYRGDDPESYDDVFNQKVGDDDLEPLIKFLDFINNSDDATFSDELGSHLDIDAFATYLAFQDVIGNFDDMSGPGNNSYLHYDPETEIFTVVNWDLNLAFNTANIDGGGPGAAGAAGGPGAGAAGGAGADGGPGAGAAGGAGVRPENGERPEGLVPNQDGGGRDVAGGPLGGNILAERFEADPAFAALVEQATAEVTESLFSSGLAADIVAEWSSTLKADDGNLVTDATIESNAAAITAAFPS